MSFATFQFFYIWWEGLAQLQAQFILGFLIVDYLWLLYAEPIVVMAIFVAQIGDRFRQLIFLLSTASIYAGLYYYSFRYLILNTVEANVSFLFFLLPSILSIALGLALIAVRPRSSGDLAEKAGIKIQALNKVNDIDSECYF